MSDNKTAQIATKAVTLDEEQRLVHIIATTPSLDRDLESISTGDILVPIRPSGNKYARDLDGTERTKVKVLIDHEWAIKSQAGIAEHAKMNANGELEMWLRLSKNANGQFIYDLIKEDMTDNSWSIGYSLQNATLEDGQIKNIELLEVSAVATASNRDAETISWKSIKEEKSMTELEKKKAQLKALEDEIAEAEAPVVESEKVEEAEVSETEEPTPVVEAEVEAVEVETPKETEVVEAEEVEEVIEATETDEETKSIKESTKMTEKVNPAIKTIDAPTQEIVEVAETKKLDKVDFAAKQFVAWLNKDHKTLSELNAEAIKSYSDNAGTKETYLNAGTLADGGAIVPDARLMSDVLTTLGVYSQVAQDLRVITLMDGDSLDIATLVQDVIVSEVATEGGVKPVVKPVFGKDNLALREFAGISIMTKKLVRQAAVNVYDILRESFARAVAQNRAEVALTDADSGIVNQSGTATIVTASADGIATWNEIKTAPYKVPVAAINGTKYYISREQLEALDTAVDLEGRDLDIVELDGAEGLTGRFKNGFRFAVEEELGGENPHVVFGAMGRFGILLRQGTVESETFDTGTVVDGSSVTHNLLQQNKLAHRVAFYENVGYPLPGAFAVSETPAS